MYVPNSAVGALIGTRGSFIRNIIRFSGASVKIAPLAQDQQVDAGYERQVTIVGNPEAQWKVCVNFVTSVRLIRLRVNVWFF